MLRDVASQGVWVSAHPDVTLKMGVKEVLHRTKQLGWGADTHLYRTARSFREEFPSWLQSNGPRVLKQNRGNGGQGVWKVEREASATGWCPHGPRVGGAAWQHAGDRRTRGLHDAVRSLLRPRKAASSINRFRRDCRMG